MVRFKEADLQVLMFCKDSHVAIVSEIPGRNACNGSACASPTEGSRGCNRHWVALEISSISSFRIIFRTIFCSPSSHHPRHRCLFSVHVSACPGRTLTACVLFSSENVGLFLSLISRTIFLCLDPEPRPSISTWCQDLISGSHLRVLPPSPFDLLPCIRVVPLL